MTMNRTPLAVVDRSGTIWPWDGREENEKVIEVGSRYIYDKGEFKRLMENAKLTNAAETSERKKRANNPGKKPKDPESPGTAKEVKSAVLDL